MNKLFVLVPFMVVVSMSYSANCDKKKALVQIIFNSEKMFIDAEGSLEEAGSNDPKIFGNYDIEIDDKKTVYDLVEMLYRESGLFEDADTGSLIQGLAIVELSWGCVSFLWGKSSRVLNSIGIQNGKQSKLKADLGKQEHVPGFSRELSIAYYKECQQFLERSRCIKKALR